MIADTGPPAVSVSRRSVMRYFIQLTRHLYEEPHQLNLVIIASNGLAAGSLEFYSNSDRLHEFGIRLAEFPVHSRDSIFCQRGYEEQIRPWGWYFMCRAVALNEMRDCAIRMRFNNNGRNPPDGRTPESDALLTDFWIRSTTDRIRKLGNLIAEFSGLKHRRLYWDAEQALIDNALEFKDRRCGDNLAAAWASLPEWPDTRLR